MNVSLPMVYYFWSRNTGRAYLSRLTGRAYWSEHWPWHSSLSWLSSCGVSGLMSCLHDVGQIALSRFLIRLGCSLSVLPDSVTGRICLTDDAWPCELCDTWGFEHTASCHFCKFMWEDQRINLRDSVAPHLYGCLNSPASRIRSCIVHTTSLHGPYSQSRIRSCIVHTTSLRTTAFF